MLVLFSSGHNRKKALVLLLESFDHYVVVFLYEQVRPERHHRHPYLHQQMGLK